jgi:hypothetical protein
LRAIYPKQITGTENQAAQLSIHKTSKPGSGSNDPTRK